MQSLANTAVTFIIACAEDTSMVVVMVSEASGIPKNRLQKKLGDMGVAIDQLWQEKYTVLAA